MICFSATKNEILESIHQWINMTPKWVENEQKMTGNGNVKHVYIESPVRKKDELLRKFANMKEYQALVFVNSLANAGILAEKLQYHNIPCALLTSQENQINRKAAIQAFKKGEVPILLTTDVAARGLDISGVTHVYNYDIPQDPESYVHRIGRTGRAGQEGMSVTFVTPNEMDYLRVIEDLTRKRMTALRPPTQMEAIEGQMKSAIEQIDEKMKSVDTRRFKEAISYLLDEYEADELAALLVSGMIKDPTEIPVKITPERPLPSRKRGNSRGNYNRSERKDNRGRNGKGSFKRKEDRRGRGLDEEYTRGYKSKDSRRRNHKKKSDKGFTIRQK